jgi:hypothetical protein
MKKMTTLFKVIYGGFSGKEILPIVREENRWVFTQSDVKATRKYDGTACMIEDGRLYRRYDAKKGKKVPTGAIPCCEADLITGHHPYWILCEKGNPRDSFHFEAFNKKESWKNGTYELCGEKVQGNPEKIKGHELILHGEIILYIPVFNFGGFKHYLEDPKNDIEGIVFYGENGELCKLRKSDFGIKRQNNNALSTTEGIEDLNSYN